MNNKIHIPYILIIGVLIFLLFMNRSCSGDGDKQTKKITVTVPEQKGTLPTINNPVPQPPITRTVIKWKDKEIPMPYFADDSMLTAYKSATDSLQRYKMFAEAIGERDYNVVQEDSLLRIESKIKARGEVLQSKVSYTIKPREISVKVPEVRFRILAGGEINNIGVLKGNLHLQNKKGDLFTAGYDTDRRIWVGYSFSLFKVEN